MENRVIMITNGLSFTGYVIRQYVGLVSGDVLLRNAIPSDLTIDYEGSLSSEGLDRLEAGDQLAIQRLRQMAAGIPNANAVCNVSLTHTVLSSVGGTVLITATGTAVSTEAIIENTNSPTETDSASEEKQPEIDAPVTPDPINPAVDEEIKPESADEVPISPDTCEELENGGTQMVDLTETVMPDEGSPDTVADVSEHDNIFDLNEVSIEPHDSEDDDRTVVLDEVNIEPPDSSDDDRTVVLDEVNIEPPDSSDDDRTVVLDEVNIEPPDSSDDDRTVVLDEVNIEFPVSSDDDRTVILDETSFELSDSGDDDRTVVLDEQDGDIDDNPTLPPASVSDFLRQGLGSNASIEQVQQAWEKPHNAQNAFAKGPRWCPNCHAGVEPDMLFCFMCGTKLR